MKRKITKRTKPQLDIFARRQIKIASDTVKNPLKGMFLGGPSLSEAKQILRDYGYTEQQITLMES